MGATEKSAHGDPPVGLNHLTVVPTNADAAEIGEQERGDRR